ncbi:MAG: N-acetylmuramic acid 6-phosphate etherase [Paenibacillaceae bacterium]
MKQEIKHNLTTEQRNEKTSQLDQLSVWDIIEVMNREDQTVAYSVQQALPRISVAIERIVEVIQQGGKLYYIGAGTSGRLGILDASECPPTFGVGYDLVIGIIAGGEQAIMKAIENAEDNHEEGARIIAAQITAKDVVVGITASGVTPYVIGAMIEANRIGAVTVGISCNKEAPLSSVVEFPIEVPVGAEIITGSTRLKAGTAQKMVLNMITTAAMIKLGKVYGNLMVNMQATNQKLRDRVVRIIADAADVDLETAQGYCEQSQGDARAAILMIRYKISYNQAMDALQLANQHFGHAMLLLEE